MTRWKQYRWLGGVALGLLVGLALSGFWPQTPLHAVASDRSETFGMATGYLDAEVEAVYLLDYLTGDLTAVVAGKQPGTWTGLYRTNVAGDLGADRQRNPKFMMVTGVATLRRGGGSRLQPSGSMCYVADVTSGRVAAYAILWSPTMYAAGQPQGGQIRCVGVTQFRQPTAVAPADDEGPRKR
jgi:hypothetical protein